MPKIGYKSITIPQSVYDTFQTFYEKQKEPLKLQGIFSFTAFITFKLYKLLKSEKV